MHGGRTEERGDSMGDGGGGGLLCFAFLHLQDVPIRHLFLLVHFMEKFYHGGGKRSCVNKNTVS